jgi:hypothetical protein
VRAELTMTLIYDDKKPIQKRSAKGTLGAANDGLRLLRACERQLTGKAPKVSWSVNIYSLSDRAVIEFGGRSDDGTSQLVARRAMDCLHQLWGEPPEVAS